MIDWYTVCDMFFFYKSLGVEVDEEALRPLEANFSPVKGTAPLYTIR